MEQKLVYDIKKIKSGISFSSIVLLYDQIDSEGNVLCPFHQDHTPSLHVYSDGAFCFTCRTRCDVISYVQAKEDLSFLAAVKFLADKIGVLPEAEIKQKNDYRGPIPLTIIKHWHSQLSKEKRQYLYDRLITDETIDTNLIGYAQDREAFSIPFWSGFPGHSTAEIVQFRVTPDHKQDGKRYFGYKYHNKPSIINRHLINDEFVGIIFGVLDSELAAQDGLPIISTNGSTVYSDPDREEAKELVKMLNGVKRKIIIPDNTLTEFTPAFKLAEILEAEVKFFGEGNPKDYTNYRLAGHTAEDFITEILQMPEFLYYTDNQYNQYYSDLLDEIIDGDAEGAKTYLLIFQEEKKYPFGLISRNIQYECGRKPYYTQVFNPEEFSIMAEDFLMCNNYTEMKVIVEKWCELSQAKQGAF